MAFFPRGIPLDSCYFTATAKKGTESETEVEELIHWQVEIPNKSSWKNKREKKNSTAEPAGNASPHELDTPVLQAHSAPRLSMAQNLSQIYYH